MLVWLLMFEKYVLTSCGKRKWLTAHWSNNWTAIVGREKSMIKKDQRLKIGRKNKKHSELIVFWKWKWKWKWKKGERTAMI